MERLWLTDCAYLLTKPDHWFCPQRCAVLDGETRQGLPAEERAGCIPLPYVEIETLHRAFFDRKADGLLRRQYLRILRTSADRDAAIDAVGRMLEERNLTGEYAAFERPVPAGRRTGVVPRKRNSVFHQATRQVGCRPSGGGIPGRVCAGWSAYVSRNGSAKSSPTAAGRKNSGKWPNAW